MIRITAFLRVALVSIATATIAACSNGLQPDDNPLLRPTTGTGVVVGFPREKVDYAQRVNGEPVGRLSIGDSVSLYMRYNADDTYAPLDRLRDTARSLAWKVFATNSGSGAFGEDLAIIHTRGAGRGVLIARAVATSVTVGAMIGSEYYGEDWVHSCVGDECVRVYIVIR